MSEYLLLVVSGSVLVALGGLILYGEQNERAARAAMGVVLLCAVALPPIKAVLAFSDIDVSAVFDELGEGENDSALSEIAKDSFAEGTKKLILDEFSLADNEVKVHIFGLDAASMRAQRIVVVLSGRAALSDLRGIKALVEESELGNCEVKIEAS